MMIISSTLFGATLNLEKVADKSGNVESGETITYTIRYTCQSTEEHCENVVIEDILDSSLQYEKHYDSGDVASSSWDGSKVTWTFNSTLEAGSTGE
jgi:fimbrial isopeptide formation D2 family protein